jgi:tRNA pseudouridine32 synthase/23S rRNA pseudouridine746 synthase
LEKFEKHIPVEKDYLAIELLAEHCSLSKSRLKDAMTKGAVWLSSQYSTNRASRVRRAKRKVTQGETLHIYFDSKVLDAEITEPSLIDDCLHYSVWNKPSGVLSQGSKWGDHCTVTRWAEQHLTSQRNAFLVHRLDRAASGLILIAHSKQAAAALSNLFATRQIKKTYHAVVEGIWSEQSPLLIDQELEGKTATSRVSLLSTNDSDQTSLVSINIDTGRKHQIRRHLELCGHPIVGDRIYNDSQHHSDLKLTSVFLSFICPIEQTQKEFQIDSPYR